MMTYFSQRDPRWANVRIGNTRLRVGDWGCTLTGIASLLSFYGIAMTPGQVARYPGLFNARGEILWFNVTKLSKGKLKFVRRWYARNDREIKKSILDSPKTCVLIRVTVRGHWVVGIGVTPDGRDYWIMDTLDGKKKQLFKTYPNITGSAHMTA
jgi:hypothetical protein